jgi:hypothetical protein
MTKMEDIQSMKFTFGDRVVSKRTGLPAVGIITGITNGMFFLKHAASQNKGYGRWHKLYPDWPTKPVYTVEFLSPQRNCTFEEFKETFPRERPDLSVEDLTIEVYRVMVPVHLAATYPEDDLEREEE